MRRYQLDAFGRNHVIQEVNGASTYNTTFTYDLAGNLTQINNQNNENIYYAYDEVGNKVAMADPYLGQWTYQRDAAGRIRVQTDARGDVVTNSYINPVNGQQDALGRVREKAVFSSIAAFQANTQPRRQSIRMTQAIMPTTPFIRDYCTKLWTATDPKSIVMTHAAGW